LRHAHRSLGRKIDIHKTYQDNAEPSKNLLQAAVTSGIDRRCEEKKQAHPHRPFGLHHKSKHPTKH